MLVSIAEWAMMIITGISILSYAFSLATSRFIPAVFLAPPVAYLTMVLAIDAIAVLQSAMGPNWPSGLVSLRGTPKATHVLLLSFAMVFLTGSMRVRSALEHLRVKYIRREATWSKEMEMLTRATPENPAPKKAQAGPRKRR
eukprot:TRINITY_DN25549_c0_g1_i2.p2 TRINITY_DN25549_c0_g1~~TRINITY_DN25549_c0_g1_i2.p2  ORF type:complete len:142 (+),score=42.96 TRINITY_DN25549_c0_g1_i2:82-507(+)